jgi:acetyl-CoA acetyltransferase
VAEPITRLMCSLVNDGGSCVVVTSADRARDRPHPPVWVVGGAMEQRYTAWYDVPTLELIEARPRMLAGLRAAGVGLADVDLVTIYDHFPIGVIEALECLGFCEPGEGGAFVEERCGMGPGRLPVSPHGGCQSHSHNMVPYNHNIVEAVRQFRGDVPDRCPGGRSHTYDPAVCRQVRDPRLAIACGPLTGTFSYAILAKD